MKEIDYDKPREVGGGERKPSAKPAVRTFRDDVQELIKEKGETRTSIAFAEASRREARGEKRFPVEEEGSHLGRVILILFFVLAFGIGVGSYALFGNHLNSLLGKESTSTPPIPTTDDIEVGLANSPREQVLADISIAFGKTFLPTGQRRAIVFTTIDESGDSRKATKEEFLSAISTKKVPSALYRSLDTQFTYEVYSSSTLSGVITLGSRSYADSFAATLDWEPDMAEALIPALDPWYNRKNILNLTGRKFKDEQYKGTGIRTLYDLDGNSVLSYGFINKRSLVIAGKIDGIRSIIEQEEQQKITPEI